MEEGGWGVGVKSGFGDGEGNEDDGCEQPGREHSVGVPSPRFV